MSVQTSGTEELPAGPPQAGAGRVGAAEPEKAPQAWRILGLAAVCLGVAALAAATFVLSYSAIRTVALQAGITPRLARGYPLLLDAMLVIVLAAVLALRSAGLPSRLLAWLTLLVVVAAAAGADALHAAGRTLPHQSAAIAAAVLPWVLVLVAFALLLAMLRHARLRRAASTHGGSAPYEPGPPAVAEADPGFAGPAGAHPDLAADADAADDPSTGEGDGEPADGTTPYPDESPPDAAYGGAADTTSASADQEADDVGSAQPGEVAEQDNPDMPVFHRMWSAPTPPAGP